MEGNIPRSYHMFNIDVAVPAIRSMVGKVTEATAVIIYQFLIALKELTSIPSTRLSLGMIPFCRTSDFPREALSPYLVDGDSHGCHAPTPAYRNRVLWADFGTHFSLFFE